MFRQFLDMITLKPRNSLKIGKFFFNLMSASQNRLLNVSYANFELMFILFFFTFWTKKQDLGVSSHLELKENINTLKILP